MQENNDKYYYIFGSIFVIWLALLIAPFIHENILDLIMDFSESMKSPFSIKWCNDSLMLIIVFVLCYLIGMYLYLSSRKNYRKSEEHGSAKWGNAKSVNKKYMQKPKLSNKILTKHVRIGYNSRKHLRNLNTVVIGGSGAGKTRFYAKPNIMQGNTSFIVLDPKGEILKSEGNLLKKLGYEIKVLDLVNMNRSDCYNPFIYLQSDNDVQKLVTNIFKATTPKGSQTQDPFWDTTAAMFLNALIFYLWHEAPVEEQNFEMVMEMVRAADVKEDDSDYISPLDILFNQLALENPDHIAVKYYQSYRAAAGKTIKSIQITLISRIEKFNLDAIAGLTRTDEMNLQSIGEKKTALFAIIPDNDTSFNFLINILYTQLFQHLFYIADYKYDGRLPVHVHFLMDEFANVSLPDDFPKILSVMRSREVSVSIILQNLSQLKALFEKDWESIVGNCDELLYLGGNEQSTHKYISEMLGKATIILNTYGKSSGRNGNFSTNYQITGRELLTPDEARMLDNDYALIFIRGERPIIDKKYDIIKHPNYKYSGDAKSKYNYIHGNITNSVATINLDFSSIKKITNEETTEDNILNDYEIISSDEIDKYFKSLNN